MRISGEYYPVTVGMHSWDGTVTEEALERVLEVIRKDSMTTDRGDGGGRIRPSSIGEDCERKPLLSFHGYRTPREGIKGEMIMNSGTWRHYRYQLIGLSMGWLTDIELKVTYEPWLLSGNIDGRIDDGSFMEFKSVNSYGYKNVVAAGVPTRKHLWQTLGYFIATGTEHSSVVYEDRNFSDFVEFRVHRGEFPEVERELTESMERLMEHLDAGDFPPILPKCLAMTGKQFKDCRWKESCFREQ